jgi:hypothetical protein
MLGIGYAKSVTDEGSPSADPSPVSNSLRSFEPPSPARGEGKNASAYVA